MRNSKPIYRRISALIRVGGKYLLVRALNEDGSGKSGFHLPGTAFNEGDGAKKLKRYFSTYHNAKVEVYGGLEVIEKGQDALFAFLTKEIDPLLFPRERFQYGFYSPTQIDTMNVEAADIVAIKKCELYLPLLQGKKRVTALEPYEVDKIEAMLRSLEYFRTRLPKAERDQFYRLVNSEISYSDLVKAYRFLLWQFDINYYEFADRPSGKRGRDSYV